MVGIVGEMERRSVVTAATAFRASLHPCNRDWLKKRLSAMALAFGHERDPERLAAWLSETGRLLLDLPQDILADAIDEAIKRSERGFRPAVGQIRAIADPAAAIRRQQADRLDAMARVITKQTGGSSTNVVRPWEHNVAERVIPDDDRIAPDRIVAFNRNMKKFGCSTRCAEDGRTYELQRGQLDPADEITA